MRFRCVGAGVGGMRRRRNVNIKIKKVSKLNQKQGEEMRAAEMGWRNENVSKPRVVLREFT